MYDSTGSRIKAVGLLSGGLDSTLAAKVLLDQNIEVHAINFVSPFCTCTPKSMGCSAVVKAIEQLGNIPLKRVVLGNEYLHMVKSPRHGYGRGLNPCLDCRIMKIRKAAEYMGEIGASFLFTGEVLGQRPMSQHRRAIDIIDKDSGVAGLILRPLSATHFRPTIPESAGIVDRSKLLGFEGRTRKPQIALAKQMNINEYPCPNGGCLLTDTLFAEKLSDYFTHCECPTVSGVQLLKVGRHIRTCDGKKVIVAKNEKESILLEQIAPPEFTVYTPENFIGPLIISEADFTVEIVDLFFKFSKIPSAKTLRVLCRKDGKQVLRDLVNEAQVA